MACFIGLASNGTTGNIQFSGVDFLPTKLTIIASQKSAVNETFAHQSTGVATVNGTYGLQQGVSTIIQDKSHDGDTNLDANYCLWLKRYDGSSNVATAVKASFVSFDNLGGGAYGVTLNFSTADSSYPFIMMAEA